MPVQKEAIGSTPCTSLYSVVVKTLSKETTENSLFHNFKSCGKIAKDGVAILKHDNGASKCIGFVNFVDVDGQRNALSKMNGQIIDGKVISVEEKKSKGLLKFHYKHFCILAPPF